MVSAEAIVDAFGAAGYRLTEPRRALAGLIAARDGHFTAAELVREAERGALGVGRATVFRSLDVLVDLGFIEQIDLPAGGRGFVACTPAVHHHHLVCTGCGRSTDVAASGLSGILRDIGLRSGYRIESHRLELFGRCPACQRAPRAPEITGSG